MLLDSGHIQEEDVQYVNRQRRKHGESPVEPIYTREDAAEALGITAHRLKALGLIDKVGSEPVGGAHRDTRQMASQLKRALVDALRQVSDLKPNDLLERRYQRLQSYGRYADTKDR